MQRSVHKAESALVLSMLCADYGDSPATAASSQGASPTATAIKHVVAIFNETMAVEHRCGTYPHTLNPPGEAAFTPVANRPGLIGLTGDLPTKNPNLNPAKSVGPANPFHLDRPRVFTADQDPGAKAEQTSFDRANLDLLPANAGKPGTCGTGAFDLNNMSEFSQKPNPLLILDESLRTPAN